MQRYFDPTLLNFLFLVPLAGTVVAQLSEGTAYAFVKPGGAARGLHPTEGLINGRYEISDDGVVCVEVVPGDPRGLGN